MVHEVLGLRGSGPSSPRLGHALGRRGFAELGDLHGHTELSASGYSDRLLDAWATQCQSWRAVGRDGFVFFDNDFRGHAPWNAMALQSRVDPLTRSHTETARTPA